MIAIPFSESHDVKSNGMRARFGLPTYSIDRSRNSNLSCVTSGRRLAGVYLPLDWTGQLSGACNR